MLLPMQTWRDCAVGPAMVSKPVEQKRNAGGIAPAADALLEGLNSAQRSAATFGIGAEGGPVPPLLIATTWKCMTVFTSKPVNGMEIALLLPKFVVKVIDAVLLP